MNEDQRNEDEMLNIDPLSRFMFGPRKDIERRKPEILSENKENEDMNVHDRSHKYDEWLFGKKKHSLKESESAQDSLSGKVGQILNNVNVEELMNHINTLADSAGHLKPLLKKASPLIEKFIKK